MKTDAAHCEAPRLIGYCTTCGRDEFDGPKPRRGVRTIIRLKQTLRLIVDIAEGSTTADSLPNIARIAREELAREGL